MSTDASNEGSASVDDQLTEDERGAFERLADRYEGEDIGRICEVVLQSNDADNEEASS